MRATAAVRLAGIAGVAGIAGLALAVAGCGSAAPHTDPAYPAHNATPQTPGTVAATVQSGHAAVAIRNFMFQPSVLTVRVGTRVTWTQDDASVHTVTDAGAFASGPLAQGASFSHTFTRAGTYHYVCTIHLYMKGTVTVVG